MRVEYTFTSYQNEALTELLAELEPMKLLLTDLSVSQEQARALVANLPDDLAPERRAAAVAPLRCRADAADGHLHAAELRAAVFA